MVLVPIQASALNAPPRFQKSLTELARQAAHAHGWLFDTDTSAIHDGAGDLIAESLEVFAAAAQYAGWFSPNLAGIEWGTVRLHYPEKASAAIRQHVK